MTTTKGDPVLEQALGWHQGGQGAVLATVIDTWGSAPRRTGAQLVVSGAGEIEGSVSGGCVEGAVVFEAQEALEAGQAKLLEYGVSDDDAFAVGLACGGTIRILLEPVGSAMPETTLVELAEAIRARRPVAYVVDVNGGGGAIVEAGHADRFSRDRSGLEEDGAQFVRIYNPPLRLLVVGAVHIAQALLPMARIAGYDPVIIDPRAAFATPERFPDTPIYHDWPDEALAEIGMHTRTALVLLTHDPKLDDPAIAAALKADVFYIGALGSTRTHAKRVARLSEAGFDAADIARIHGPIGLNIGAASPQEIAVSIIAQMTDILRRGA
jgi:xanthine dehydrogenase accessory factor